MLRAYHHRALAIGLPFVLNGLFEETIFLQCAMSYCHWRCLLQDHEFVIDRQSRSSAIRDMASLKEVHDAGQNLQKYMNSILKDVRESDDIEICGNIIFVILVLFSYWLQRVRSFTKSVTGLCSSNRLVHQATTMLRHTSQHTNSLSRDGKANFNTVIAALYFLFFDAILLQTFMVDQMSLSELTAHLLELVEWPITMWSTNWVLVSSKSSMWKRTQFGFHLATSSFTTHRTTLNQNRAD